MAFNAGSIEATLTLDRNPFSAGLKAARAEAKAFAERDIKANVVTTVKLRLEQGAAANLRESISKITGTANVKLKLDTEAVKYIKERIGKIAGTATANLKLNNESIAKLKERIARINGTVTAKLVLDKSAISEIREKIKALSTGITATINVNVRDAQLRLLQERIRNLEARTAKAQVEVDIKAAQLLILEERLNELQARRTEHVIDFDIKTAKLLILEEQMRQLEEKRAQIQVDFDIKTAKLLQLEEQMLQLEMRRLEIPIDFDIKRTRLALLEAQLRRLEAQNVQIPIDFDIKTARLELLRAQLERVRAQTDLTAERMNDLGNRGNGAFRHLDNGVRIVLATLPLILSIGGSAITGLIGLVGALTSAFGVAALGLAAFATAGVTVFKDITNAADLSGKAAKQAAASMKQIENARRNLQRVTESAAESEAAAARRVGDAEENLRRTVENAAHAKAAAQRQVENATRSLERAQESARLAQERLTEARRDAREELEDLQLSLRGGAIAEEQAVLDLEEAQLRLAEARKAGVSGNDLKQLELDVKRAALEVDVTKERYGDLKQESAEWAKTGIEGSKGVQDAQRGVRDATEGVSEAERNLALAREEAARTTLDANRDIADAERNLADARAAAAKAHRDAQRDIADAQRALADAEREAAADQQKFTVQRTAAFLAAVEALKNLKAEYDALVRRVQDPVSNAFAANFNAIAALLKTLDPIIIAVSNALTQIGQKMEQYFGGPLWKQFVDFMAQNAGPTLLKLFDILAYGTQGVMNLVQAFNPLGQWLLDKIVQGMKDFADWTSKLGSNPEFQKFIALAKESLPIIGDFIWSIVKFLFKLSEALAPVGNMMAKVFTEVFNALSQLPPEMLQAIALALGAIIAALVLGATGGTAGIIGIIVGLGVALKTLYDKCVPFREMIDRIWNDMKSRFGPVFEYLTQLFKDKVGPAFERVQKIFEEKFLPAFERLYNFLAPILAWLLKVIGEEVVAVFEALLLVVENVIGAISGIIDTFIGLVTGDWDTFWNGLKTVAESVLGIILGIFGVSLDDFYSTISGWWESIKTGWSDFWNWLDEVFTGWCDSISQFWDDFWTGFSTTASQWWEKIKTTWDQYWTWLLDIFNDWWQSIKKFWNDFWTGFGLVLDQWIETIKTKWNNFWTNIKNFVTQIWEAIKLAISGFMDLIRGDVDSAADKIGQAWRKIANLFRDPINWVINTVVNDGVLAAWNTVMGWIGAESLNVGRVPEIPMFAEGGQVVGPGHGTSDSILARVSNGEYIMPAAITKRHAHFLESLRQGQPEAIRAAGGGNNANPYPRYAAGGMVDAGLNFARREAGKPYVWGGVGPGGYDCSGFMSAITNVLMNRAPHSRVGTTDSAPWPGWATGLNSQFGVGYFKGNPGHMAGTLAGMNVESRGGAGSLVGSAARGATNPMFSGHMSLPQVAGQFTDGGAGGGIMASLWSILGSKVESLFTSLLNKAGFPGQGPMGEAIWNLPVKLIGKVVGQLKEKLSSMFTSVGGGASGDPAVVEAVRQVANQFGWGSGPEWDALSALIAKESSWNPNAANPSSSARGLFQKMTSIHGPVEATPEGQAQWGLNYIKGRYGTPSKAWAFHQANNYYDRGGMLMPGVSPVNTSGVPERILSPAQTESFNQLVEILQQLVAEDGPLRNGTNAPLIGSLAVTTTPRASAQDIIEEATYQMRKARRQGVYRR